MERVVAAKEGAAREAAERAAKERVVVMEEVEIFVWGLWLSLQACVLVVEC